MWASESLSLTEPFPFSNQGKNSKQFKTEINSISLRSDFLKIGMIESRLD